MNESHALDLYLGYKLQVFTEDGVFEGVLVDVKEDGIRLQEASLGWQLFEDVLIERSSIRSIACLEPVDDVVVLLGLNLSVQVLKAYGEQFKELNARLALLGDVPYVRPDQNLAYNRNGFTIRFGRLVVEEGLAESVDEVIGITESYFHERYSDQESPHGS